MAALPAVILRPRELQIPRDDFIAATLPRRRRNRRTYPPS